MGKLIINADDFGYSPGINAGIVSAHKNGVVSSTTIMANMPGFDDGVRLLNETKTLVCGVHLTLSCYKPLLTTHKTLVDKNGYFFKRLKPEVVESFDLEELYNEWCAQIDKAQKEIYISHIDSHHFAHTRERFRPVVKKIAEKYNLPMRHKLDGIESVPTLDFTNKFYEDSVSVEWFEGVIEEIKEKGIVDMMTHPGFLDSFVCSSTSYQQGRLKEYDILTDNRVKEILDRNNIEVINYRQL